MKHLTSTLLTALILCNFLITSCNKDSEIVYEADVDVFVEKKLVDGVVKYAPVYYAYGTASIESVTVTSPGELATIDLEQSASYSTIFLSNTSETDYTEEMPLEGSYTFNIKFESGSSYSASEYFYSEELDLPVISEYYWDSNYSSIYLSSESVSNAYAYNVSFRDADNSLIFSSIAYNSESSEILINTNTTVWYDSPASDLPITVELNAYSFDSDASEDEWTYNIQCNSVSATETVWNPTSN